jgi:hypothetical protein
MGTPLSIHTVTALSLDPGGQVVVHGAVTTSVDGSVFDVAMQADGLSPGAMRAGGLFDLAAGGLRIVQQSVDRHEYTLASTGVPGTGCTAAGIGSPCLVPRIAVLAHERLKTSAELAATLSGGVQIEGVIAPPVPLVEPETVSALSSAAVVAALAIGAWAALVRRRRRASSPIGRVRTAAREAIGATQGDPTLQGVRTQVQAMLLRAEQLDTSRRGFATRLARIDRASLERRRDAMARSTSPDAAEALAWLTAECAEAERLQSDLASTLVGLERIESAMRVVSLRAREGRGTRARAEHADPVDATALELVLREEAIVEVEAEVPRSLHS